MLYTNKKSKKNQSHKGFTSQEAIFAILIYVLSKVRTRLI